MMMLRFVLPLVLAAASMAYADTEYVYYDSFNGSVLEDYQIQLREEEGNSYYCVNKFAVCNSTEWRRIDGSCTNLDTPYAGGGASKFTRVRPAFFDLTTGSGTRLSATFEDLPSARWLRTRALSEGRVSSRDYSQLMLLFAVFAGSDIAQMSIPEIVNYMSVHTTCCTDAAVNDSMCYPISVPANDPVHRYSGITCLNMTLPISFQSTGCINANITPPYRLNYGTPTFDLSQVYGTMENTSIAQRLFTGGLLNYTLTESGRQWPQINPPEVNRRDGVQGMSGVNFPIILLFWREHNRIATELAELNPSWDDDTLFYTARDIAIGLYQKILYYDFWPILFGRDNMVSAGLIADDSSTSFRATYNSSQVPLQFLEALVSMRWMHVLQEGMHQYTNTTGEVLFETEVTKLPLTYSVVDSNNTFQYYAQGAFRQPSARYDRVVDPVVADLALGSFQKSADAATSDVTKARLQGVAPYVEYVSYCDNENPYDTYESLVDYIDEDGRELLQQLYGDLRDVDLMVALWLEKPQNGSEVPRTMYCLMMEQLQNSLVSDRHWFELSDRPHAFTEDQLAEIRKASISRILCDHADSLNVTGVSAQPFLTLRDQEIVSCDTFPTVNLTLWQES